MNSGRTNPCIGAQLGLAPAAERAMRHDLDIGDAHAKWLAIADAKYEPEGVVPAPPVSAPPPPATNGTPKMPGFTTPT